ncbi:MAG: hypothetical protein NC827_05945 [Candidatus Omnitrophica bacterium]|nr:hypothetical protein [Candidatus Omnitrophota bacterium]
MSEEEWKSIKIKKDVYEELKRQGVSISEAIKLLVEKEKERIEEKMLSIEKSAKEFLPYLLKAGLFNIKISGIILNGYEEADDNIIVDGKIIFNIRSYEVRERFKNFLEEIKKGGKNA